MKALENKDRISYLNLVLPGIARSSSTCREEWTSPGQLLVCEFTNYSAKPMTSFYLDGKSGHPNWNLPHWNLGISFCIYFNQWDTGSCSSQLTFEVTRETKNSWTCLNQEELELPQPVPPWKSILLLFINSSDSSIEQKVIQQILIDHQIVSQRHQILL